MDRQLKQTYAALESAAQHIRNAAKCLDLAARSDPALATRIEAIEGQDHIGPGMADAIVKLMETLADPAPAPADADSGSAAE